MATKTPPRFVKPLIAAFGVMSATLYGGSTVSPAATPQVTESRNTPCCPNPRFLAPRTKDGIGLAATFDAPAGIAYDPDDDSFFITDAGSNTIRRYDPDGRTTTVAGACDPELVMDTCVGREVDGIGPTARLNRPSAIVYDRHKHGVIVYDSGGAAIRLVTPDGRVRTIGFVDGIAGLAIDDRNGRLFGARAQSVVEINTERSAPYWFRIWTAPGTPDRDAPAYDVNAVAVDQQTGDIYAAVFAQNIYRVHPTIGWKGELLAGSGAAWLTFGGSGKDGHGNDATFVSIGQLVFDNSRRVLYADDFRAVRKIELDGTVTTVAGGCERQQDSRYRGEFTCDYPANDGLGMKAHFAWPLSGLAFDSKRGDLAILDDETLKRMEPSTKVTTLAGNRWPQAQPTAVRWNGGYVDTATGERLDVYVNGDEEVETGSDAGGRVFDVRRGSRSSALGYAQFWNAPTYVRVGEAARSALPATALKSMHCEPLVDVGAKNPYDRSASQVPESASLFMGWYDVGGWGVDQTSHYSKSARCVALRVSASNGRITYEDFESLVVSHSFAQLIDYPDQRRIYR
jgi:DNA-binding beta-propeller fold protein YncE